MKPVNNTLKYFLLATLIISGLHVSAQKFKSQHFELKKMEEGVYAVIHKTGGHAICNSGLVDLGDATVVFDTFISPVVAEELLKAVKKLEMSPVKYVINSHYHSDHIRGNQVFGDDVMIISTEKTRELIAQKEPRQIENDMQLAPQKLAEYDSIRSLGSAKDFRKNRELNSWYGYYEALVQSLPTLQTTLPNMTIKDELTIHGSSRSIRLISYGEGHTPSDLFMILPEEGICFTGDLVFIGSHPYISDGNPEMWLNSLNMMRHMGIKRVVPGHGPLGGNEAFEEMIAYFEMLEMETVKLLDEGKTAETIGEIAVPEDYQDYMFPKFYESNIRFMLKRASASTNQTDKKGRKYLRQ